MKHPILDTRTGEYTPLSQVVNQAPPPRPKRGCLGRLFSSIIWMFVFFMLVFFGLTFGRQWYDSIIRKLDYDKTVHSDGSIVKTGIRTQVSPTVSLVYKNKDGKKVRVIADAEEYSKFVNQQVAHLEKDRSQLLAQTETQLNEKLTAVFDKMRGRVEQFADWYFAYPTTYKILWEATTSATKHVVSASAMSLSEAVSYDVEKYLHKHYEDIVLRPEISDPQLQAAYRKALQAAHENYINVLSKRQADFQAFVSKYTTHLDAPATEETVLTLDWKSQFNKFNVTNYEKGAEGAALGAALAGGGAVAGKAVGGAAGKGVFAKLSAPFVSKAVLAASGGALGTLGGPIGTVIGIVGGLGVDYAINEGVELTQRETFIADVNEAVATTQGEWEEQMLQSLHEAINIWMDDTIQLLPRYET
ncbi:MAG: hypothetical protein ABFS56_12180 [Pseudomonadota bacterium]